MLTEQHLIFFLNCYFCVGGTTHNDPARCTWVRLQRVGDTEEGLDKGSSSRKGDPDRRPKRCKSWEGQQVLAKDGDILCISCALFLWMWGRVSGRHNMKAMLKVDEQTHGSLDITRGDELVCFGGTEDKRTQVPLGVGGNLWLTVSPAAGAFRAGSSVRRKVL